ncbi:hypothetical protein [Consotaella salsifontis]|uniref:Uncharacterized protein n=1 Tax=Consotaella salsifontis TaxID=1365950 RepID=A0A1T4R5F6_9HYPH|nr:hypothetical protein [Consotaella salsifontis]SKA11115.1 hypothetical protein SAMN05428963_10632 [Consotaella salsifontis]
MSELSHEGEGRPAHEALVELGSILADVVFSQTVVHADASNFPEIASMAVDAAVNGFVEEARAARLPEADIEQASLVIQREIIRGCKNRALLTMGEGGRA